MGEVLSVCCEEDDFCMDGARDLVGSVVGAPAAAAMNLAGDVSVFDLVLGGAMGAMLYHMLGGNRPKLRLNNPNVRNYTPPPAPPPSQYVQGARRGVMVGINYFGTRSELAGCLNDVQRVAQRLHGSYQLMVLTDDQRDPRLQPTKNNIMGALTWLVQGLRPNGKQTVFFHFSGHGSQQEDTDGDEADGLDETICPVDYSRAGMISDDELKRHFVARIPAGNKLLAVMDCCHSGTVLDLPFYAIAQGTEGNARMLGDQMSDRNRIPCDALMISGCDDAQTSADVKSVGSAFVELADRRAGGALTSALLVALQRNPSQNIASLLFGVRSALQSKNFSQIPQISASLPYDMRCTVFDLFPESFNPAEQAARSYQPMQQQYPQQQPYPQQGAPHPGYTYPQQQQHPQQQYAPYGRGYYPQQPQQPQQVSFGQAGQGHPPRPQHAYGPNAV